MGGRWRIELLGGLRAQRGEEVVARLQKQQPAVLLAYLAYHSPSPRPRDTLIELLWPEADLESGRQSLRSVLHALRRLLEPPDTPPGTVLIADHSTVRLNPAVVTTDVAEFRAALAAAARADAPGERAGLLASAVALYQGELLPGFYESWVLAERQPLAEAYLAALHQLVVALEQTGDLEGALGYARQAVSADPLREEAHYDVMRLYAAVGQPSATLRQYQELERVLREELGETPSAATRALAEELRDSARSVVAARTPRPLDRRGEAALGAWRLALGPGGDEAGRPASIPSEPSAKRQAPSAAPMALLPVQFTRFFGREEEIARVTESLCIPEVRLVTLTGPGGSGKTRLAIAVAARLSGGDPRAGPFGLTAFVPLADVLEASRLTDAIADALGLRPASTAGEPLEAVVEALLGQPSLLVLDNFEHLVGEGSLQLRRLLERAPTARCLVTSRQRLGIAGEREFIVLPLPTPRGKAARLPVPRPETPVQRDRPAEEAPSARASRRREAALEPEALLRYPSVQLFLDRAQAVRPEFGLTEANAGAVAELCDRLEGLPLALELAAARAAVLSPAQMLAQMERRFELLVTRQRDVPPRHRTLLAAVEGSYQALPPELQRFFRRLSVFRGGCSLEAAEAVCEVPQALDLLTELCECSLVVAEGSTRDGAAAGEETGAEALRYRLLETLREYGWEQLAASGELSAVRNRHQAWYLRLAEQAHAAADGPEHAVWLTRLEAELDNLRAALAWCQEAADADPESDAAEAGLRLAAALWWLWYRRGNLAEGQQWLEGALARSGDLPASLRAPAIFRTASLASARGERERAQSLLRATRQEYEKALALAHASGDRRVIADATLVLAELGTHEPDVEGTLSYAAEARQQMEALGDRGGLVRALEVMAQTALWRGDRQAARPLVEERLAICRERGASELLIHALGAMGHLERDEGDYARARALYEESLGLRRKMGNQLALAQSLEDFAVLAGRQRQAERAIRLLGAAEAFCETLGARLPVADATDYERTVAEGRAALGEAAFAAAWAEGRAMSLQQAIDDGLSEP
jgi:predicted ATPase/DNA-binding SARP family transcriptional activator